MCQVRLGALSVEKENSFLEVFECPHRYGCQEQRVIYKFTLIALKPYNAPMAIHVAITRKVLPGKE